LPEVVREEGHWLANARNVGWLSPEVSFPVGKVDPRLLEWLTSNFADLWFEHARGYHECEFCDAEPLVAGSGRTIRLGSAELLIRTVAERAYVAPNFLVHYIRDHGYQPPEEFVRDVLTVASLAG
jgi:hypothetical protein